MTSVEEFEAAAVKVRTVAALPPDKLLRLYSLYKQATVGDVSGERPGALDFKGRAKYDAWMAVSGMGVEDARTAYVTLVNGLVSPP